MGVEASFYVTRLGLSEYPRPFNPYTTKTNVNPPEFGSLGSIESAMYLYSFLGGDSEPLTNARGVEVFLEPGKLAYIIRKEPFALLKMKFGNHPGSINKGLAELTNRLTTASAYQLATQWLRSVDVDVDVLEEKYQPQVAQQYFYEGPATWKLEESPPPGTPKILLPIFDVSWGGDPDSNPPVWVQIDGTSRSLIHLRMEDTRFSKRPPILLGGMNAKAAPKKAPPPFNKLVPSPTNQPAKN